MCTTIFIRMYFVQSSDLRVCGRKSMHACIFRSIIHNTFVYNFYVKCQFEYALTAVCVTADVKGKNEIRLIISIDLNLF